MSPRGKKAKKNATLESENVSPTTSASTRSSTRRRALAQPPPEDVMAPYSAVDDEDSVDDNSDVAVAHEQNIAASSASDHGTLFLSFTGFLVSVLKTTLDVLRFVVLILKIPIIILIVAYLLLLSLGHVVDVATVSLAPICAVFPGFSACKVTATAGAVAATFGNIGRKPLNDQLQRIDFPGLMAVQSRTLDKLFTHSAAGSQLALGLKHAELAVKDLVVIVKTSNLTNREVLSNSLEEFAHDAKGVGRELQVLSAKLYGTVDTVLAFDEYALRAIAEAQASGVDTTQTAARMFTSVMCVLSSEVARVIIEATTVASALDRLEEKLYNIRTLSQQALMVTEAAVGDILSDIWTVVGGNRAKLQQLTQQVDILRNVDWYRSLSVAHVVATTETLLTIEAELSELRDKLSAPELTQDTIPLEVHIASIERGAKRLTEGKLRIRADVGRLYGTSGGGGSDQDSVDASA